MLIKILEFFLNYHQHKVGISAIYIFPLVSFVKFTMSKVCCKMFLNLLINYYVLEMICQDMYKKIKLKLKHKYANLV